MWGRVSLVSGRVSLVSGSASIARCIARPRNRCAEIDLKS